MANYNPNRRPLDMPEATEMQKNSRDKRIANLHPFKPGQSGNPSGRKPNVKCFSDIARQLLKAKKIDIEYTYPKAGKQFHASMHIDSDKTMYHSLIAALLKEGLGGNVQAIKELIDRTDGKVKQIVGIDFDTNMVQMALNLNAENAPEPDTRSVADGGNS